MANVQDQFWHGRIPIRPLAFKNKSVAYTNELIIDYGADGNYRMYMTDSNDPEVLIDLTEKIANIVSERGIKVADAEVEIEAGESKPLKEILAEILHYILKADENTGFDYSRDFSKVVAPSTISSIISDGGQRAILPITLADNVFFKDGSTMQEHHSNLTRFTVSSQDITVLSNNTLTYQFNYPHEDYNDYFEVRVDGRTIDKTKYSIKNLMNGTHFSAGAVTFINNPGFSTDHNSVITVLFMYNGLAYKDATRKYMDGKIISVNSIPTSRLEKISDSYTLNDPSSIASSKALYDMGRNLNDTVASNADNTAYFYDFGEENVIEFRSNLIFPLEKPVFLCNVLLASNKTFDATVTVRNGYKDMVTGIPIVDASGKDITRGLPRGKIIQLLWVKEDNNFKLVSTDLSQLRSNRLVRKCLESETEISFDTLAYPVGASFSIYRNGLRLFEDVDYSIDYATQKINLFNATEENEVVVIEVLYL